MSKIDYMKESEKIDTKHSIMVLQNSANGFLLGVFKVKISSILSKIKD